MRRNKIFTLLFLSVIILALGIGGVFAFASDDASTTGSKGTINVWLIAGQSNAVGYGQGAPEAAELDSRYIDGFENVVYYGSRAGKVTSDFISTAVGMGKGSTYCGPEIGIASALGNSDEKHAIIKYAVGGTNLYPILNDKRTWTSPSYIDDVNGDSDPNNDVDESITEIGDLYRTFITTVENGLALLREDGYTPIIKGLLWSQGGAESSNTTHASEYEKLLRHIVNDMRNDISVIANDTSINSADDPMPFVIVKTYRNPANETEQTLINIPIINAAQSSVANEYKNVTVIDPSDAYGFYQHDAWHYSTEGQVAAGELFVSDVYATENKYLVTYNGAHTLMNSACYSEGKSVTVRFSTKENYVIERVTMTVGNGDAQNITLGDDMTYTFDMPAATVTFEVTALSVNAMPTVTKYGTIPKEYYFEQDYPIAIFKNGEFVAAAQRFNSDADKKVARSGDGTTLLLRRDYDFSQEAGGSNYLSSFSGSVTYDLGGYTVSMGKDNDADAFVKCDAYATGYSTNITLTNGKILVGEDPIVRFSASQERISSDYLNGYETNAQRFTVTLDRLNVELDARVTDYTRILVYSYQNVSGSPKEILDANLIVNECEIDLNTNGDSFYLMSRNNIDVNVEIVGGSITANDLKGVTFNYATKLTVKKGSDGNYMTVDCKSEFNSLESFNSDDGKTLIFTPASYDDSNTLYVLKSSSLYTKYGEFPTSFASYSIIVYVMNSDGTYTAKNGTNNFTNGSDSAMAYARKYLVASEEESTVVICFRSNVDCSGNFTNTAHASGNIVIDMSGYTLTQTSDNSIFYTRAKVYAESHDTLGDLNFTVKNGTIILNNKGLFWMGAATNYDDYATNETYKSFNFEFDGITISIASGGKVNSLFGTYYDDKDVSASASSNITKLGLTSVSVGMNVVFRENCTIDLTNAPSNFVLFDANDTLTDGITGGTDSSGNTSYYTNTITRVTVEGITIEAGANSFTWTKVNQSNGSYVKFTNGKNGSNASLFSASTPEGVSLGSADGKTLSPMLVADGHYVLTDINTPYGKISSSYTRYPMVVFVANDDGTYTVKNGYSSYKDMISKARSYTDNEVGKKSVVYFRCSIVSDGSSNNLTWNNGTVVIDLGGHTLYQGSASPLFTAEAKYYSTGGKIYGNPGTYVVKNGNIVLSDYGLFKIGAYGADGQYDNNASSDSYKILNFTFENVHFSLENNTEITSFIGKFVENKNIGAVSNQPEKMGMNIHFGNGCVIDVLNAPEEFVLFNACDTNYKGTYTAYCDTNSITKITVDGVEVISGDKAITWTKVSKNGSSVTFGKTNGANYMSITVPKNTTLPSDAFGEFAPIKISETKDTVTYRLTPKEIYVLNHAIKTNVTLESQIKINVYIPAESTVKFTFNGETYENLKDIEKKFIDGKEYFVVSVSLPSARTADEIKLIATVEAAGTKASATFTFSVPKYAEKVLNNEWASSVETALVKDILAYIKSAYNYFTEFNTEEEIARVNGLVDKLLDIGGSYERGSITHGETDHNSSLINSVTLNLDEKPSIRFYVKENGIEFFANGKKLNTVTGTDEAYGTYVELDVYAYVLSHTITYYLGEEQGSYHVSEYVYGVIKNENADKYAKLVELALSFVKYTESAEAYRTFVLK